MPRSRTLVLLGALVSVAVAAAVLVPLLLDGDSPQEHEPFRSTAPEPLVNPQDIIPGGPPPDGIPPIDDPRFLAPSRVSFLEPQEPVLAVEVNGDARAYPLRIMIWHEIVNDEIGGVPVSVTFCPLCNTGIAFERPTVDGQVLDFGTSGKLYKSDLVMFDRQTKTYWTQATGRAVLGELTGMQLEFVPAQIVSWADWRAAHPDGLALSQRTGFDRNYGTNPYESYDQPEAGPGFGFDPDELDPRLPPKARVLGVRVGDEVVAFPFDALSGLAEGNWAAVTEEVGGQPVVVFWKAGTVSALDEASIAESRDVGATGAFGPVVDGRTLTFDVGPDGPVDRETRSTWNILGQAVAGPLEGTQLDRVLSIDSFWFDWAAFYPSTSVFGQ